MMSRLVNTVFLSSIEGENPTRDTQKRIRMRELPSNVTGTHKYAPTPHSGHFNFTHEIGISFGYRNVMESPI